MLVCLFFIVCLISVGVNGLVMLCFDGFAVLKLVCLLAFVFDICCVIG